MDFGSLPSQAKIGIYILAALIVAVIVSMVLISRQLIKILTGSKIHSDSYEENSLFADVAYFFEKGARQKQEDSIYISHLDDYVDYGILACISDGMGGLKYGAEISRYIIDEVEKMYPFNFYESEEASVKISRISNAVYEKYGRKGGATLALIHIFEDKLNFYSVGDSNIILIRNGTPTILNYKQNYNKMLIKKYAMLDSTTEEAYQNKKGRALVDFMGNNNIRVIYSQEPIRLFDGDVIFVCSDGVTDALSLQAVAHLVGLNAKKTAEEVKLAIRQKNVTRQDNYSGVVIHLNRYNF